jgi:predicted HicB family RNase H-like nuclease
MTATTRVDPAHYAYRVFWSAEDAEYVALCTELPGLSWLDETPEGALVGIRNLVVETVDDMYANGEKVPQPLADRDYSGNFNVRIPQSLHRRLAAEAAEEGVSLNRLVSDRLARA